MEKMMQTQVDHTLLPVVIYTEQKSLAKYKILVVSI